MGLALIVVVFLFRGVDPLNILRAMSSVGPYMLLVILTHLLATSSSGLAWYPLARAAGINIGVAKAVRLVFIGSFASSFLPTSIGGDALRAWLAGRERGHYPAALWSIGTQRAVGFTVLLGLVAVGCLTSPLAFEQMSALRGTILLFAGALGLFWVGILCGAPVHKLFAPFRGLARLTRITRQSARKLKDNKRALLATLTFSVLFYSLGIFMNWLILYAMGQPVAWTKLTLIVPLVYFSTMLPFTINGIGIRENAYVFLLGSVGVSAVHVLGLSFLVTASYLVLAAIGAVFFTWERFSLPATAGSNDA